MGRRLRLADGAGPQSLKKSGPHAPRPRRATAAIASLPPERRLFNRRKRRKKASSPTIIAFQNSGHCRRARANEPGRRTLGASTRADARAAPASPLWARRLRPAPLKTTNATSAAFRRPGLSSPSRCAPSEAEAFWRCLVSRPCLPSDPYSVAGRANRASKCGMFGLEARGGAYCCIHPTIGTTA